jgi:2-polyprenyl-6-methoxyphenol hydroxylase-like FAD-dependent oxidoreductase
LIGTEGAHSKVREYLMDDEGLLLPSEIVATATITTLPGDVAQSLREVHPRYCITFHPNGYFTWYGSTYISLSSITSRFLTAAPVHNDEGSPEDWEFMIILSLASKEDLDLSGDAIVHDLRKRAESFAEPFRTVLQSSPPDTRFWHSRLGYWPTQPWDNLNGTVTLAGDAAHPMTFRTYLTDDLKRRYC